MSHTDKRLKDIAAKKVEDLTEEDAVHVDGHVAADMLANYAMLRADAEATVQIEAERATELLTVALAGERPLETEESELLSRVAARALTVEAELGARLHNLVQWSVKHGKELVGEERYERIAVLLDQRESRYDVATNLTPAEVAALKSIPSDRKPL